MNDKLVEYARTLAGLSAEEKVKRDLYLRRLAKGDIAGPLTGYASLDKPWLKFYKDEYIECEVPHMTVEEYLEKQNVNNLENIAINSPEGKYTYRDLIAKNYQVASSLKKIGVKKGDIVLGIFPTIAHEVFLFYGCDIAGAVIQYPLPLTPVKEIINTIRDLKIKNVFIFDQMLSPELQKSLTEEDLINNIVVVNFGPMLHQGDKIISWNDFLALGNVSEITKIDRTPEDLLFVAKTGGSTGKSKNVMLNDHSFNVIVNQLLHTDLPYEAKDKWIRMWPLFSATAAVSSSHLPLCAGMELILRDVLDLSKFGDLVLEERPNHLTLIAVYLEALKRNPRIADADLSFIKSWGCGGTKIVEKFEEDVNAFHTSKGLDLYLGEGYGLTENASSAAMRMSKETTKIGKVGVPLVKTTVSIFDPKTLIEKNYDEEGEICICSESFMMGYYNDEELTKDAIKMHPDGKYWLHTGDVGHMDKDGFLTVSERIKRVIDIYPTDSVYPSSLEEEIMKIPGVLDVVVVGAPDPINDGFQVPVCFAILDNNFASEIIREQIKEVVSNKFPHYAWLADVIFKEDLPRTSIGKPDFKALETELYQNAKLSRIKK